jgi:hypothetical protein
MKHGTHVIVTCDGKDNEAEYLNAVGSQHHLVRLFKPYSTKATEGLRTVQADAIRLQEVVYPT